MLKWGGRSIGNVMGQLVLCMISIDIVYLELSCRSVTPGHYELANEEPCWNFPRIVAARVPPEPLSEAAFAIESVNVLTKMLHTI